MKKFTFTVLLVISACASGQEAQSLPFTIDTRNDFLIKDISCEYCSGEHGGVGGRRATFLTDISCELTFRISYGEQDRTISYILLNGKRHEDSSAFKFNVGNLNPGEKLEVIAVDSNMNESRPFRVNFDIASLPNLWDFGGGSHANIKTIMRPDQKRVTYVASEYNVMWLWDAVAGSFEIGNVDLPLAFSPKAQVAPVFESDTGKFRATGDVGMGMDIGEALPFSKQKLGVFAGADLDMELSGGRVYQWRPQSLTWEQTSWDMGVRIVGSCDPFEVRIPQTLNLVYFKLGVRADVAFTMTEEDGVWYSDINCDPLAAIRGTVGAGCDGIACVEGFAQGGLVLHATLPGSPSVLNDLGLQMKFGWRAVLLGFERNGEWPYTYWIVGGNQRNIGARRLFSGTSTHNDMSDCSLIPRNYGRKVGKRRLLSAATLALSDVITITDDGYPNPQPCLSVDGINDLLVYLRDNTERSDINRTEIVFRSGVSNNWNLVETIWNDETADFMPKVATGLNGAVFAAWANTRNVLSDNDGFDVLCGNLEIAVGVRNTSGIWDCCNLTDNTVLDINPVLRTATNGTAAVAWLRNEYTNFFGSAVEPSDIMVAFYRDGSWTSETVAVENVGSIPSFDLAYNGEQAAIVYVKGEDSSVSGKKEIWGVSCNKIVWGEPIMLSSGETDATRPFAWYKENMVSNSVLSSIWVENGKLISCDGLVENSGVTVANADAISIPDDYTIMANTDGTTMLVWREQSNNGNIGTDVMSVVYDLDSGLLSVPTVLLGTEDVERNLSGAVGFDHASRVAYESVNVTTNSEGIIQYGDVDLKILRKERRLDVGFEADSCSFGTNEVALFQNVDIYVDVKNFGTECVTNVDFRLWFGDGEDRRLLGLGTTNIPPMSAVRLTVPWYVEQGLTNISFTAEADYDGLINDCDRSNNTFIWHPDVGCPILSLRNAQSVNATKTIRLISATIRNDGVSPLATGATVNFWSGAIGGELLATNTAGLVSSGNSGEYGVGFSWDMADFAPTSAFERVVIELLAGDIHPTVSVDVMTALDSDDDGLLDGEEIALGTNPNKADSDDDGICDYDEVYVVHTDPVTKPFDIGDSALPDGRKGATYKTHLYVDGGTAPYVWSLVADTSFEYATNTMSSTFEEVGAAWGKGTVAPISERRYRLPFPFPFYDRVYTNVWINVNGTVSFDRSMTETYFYNSLTNRVFIGAMLASLDFTDGDIYVTRVGAEYVTFRWKAAYSNSPVNFSITLFPDGTFKMAYGAGNNLRSYQCVSAGDGVRYAAIYSSQNMINQNDMVWSPQCLPPGLRLETDGTILGTPEIAIERTLNFRVTDSQGRVRLCKRVLSILAENNAPSITSVAPESIDLKIMLGESIDFRCSAMDKDGDIMSYQWILDGTNIVATGTTTYTFSPSENEHGEHELICVVSDGNDGCLAIAEWRVHVGRNWYVDSGVGISEHDGKDWETAFAEIYQATEAATNDDVVFVASGVYAPVRYNYKYLSIYSMSGAEHTIIDGGGTNLCIGASCKTIRGFTLRNGASNYGGGVSGGTLEDCVITSCVSTNGSGGGAYSAALKNCLIERCEALNGSGGGAYYGTMENCIVKDCSAKYGGGVCGGTLKNCVITGNRASQYAGGTYNATLYNCTVCGNTAEYQPAGMYSGTAYNAIIWDNYLTVGTLANYQYGTFYSCCTTPLATNGSNNMSDDPRLVSGVNGDARLRVGSPCKDAGEVAYIVSEFDVVSNPRSQGYGPDIGAYEGTAIEGIVVDTRIDGYGADLQPKYALIESGSDLTFNAHDGVRPFVGFMINGVWATSDNVLTLHDITYDSIVTAVYSNYTFFVDATFGDDSNDGLSTKSAFRTIQAGVNTALPGECVIALDGEYSAFATDDKRVRIESQNGAVHTIVSGGMTNVCAVLGNGNTTVSTNTVLVGFSLQNGWGQNGGAAIGGVLERCIISGNQATYGGGLYNSMAKQCIITNNLALYGGGGMYCGNAYQCRIVGNMVSNDTSSAMGGGAYNVTMHNCLIADNLLIATNSYGYGSGAYSSTLYNCTIANNAMTAKWPYGAGTYSGTQYNCAYCTNMANGVSQDWMYGTRYNCLAVDKSVFADGGYCPIKQSMLIEAGNNSYVFTDVDLAGKPRLHGSYVDIGAYEYQVIETELSPAPVPYEWLDKYLDVAIVYDGDYEVAAVMQSPGKDGLGKMWPNGSPCYVWQDFVAGTSPTNDTVFTATIRMEGNTPVVTWAPDTPELRATRVYRMLGKKTLLDTNWTDITDKDQSEYHFFRVTVDMP